MFVKSWYLYVYCFPVGKKVIQSHKNKSKIKVIMHTYCEPVSIWLFWFKVWAALLIVFCNKKLYKNECFCCKSYLQKVTPSEDRLAFLFSKCYREVEVVVVAVAAVVVADFVAEAFPFQQRSFLWLITFKNWWEITVWDARDVYLTSKMGDNWQWQLTVTAVKIIQQSVLLTSASPLLFSGRTNKFNQYSYFSKI